MRLRRKPNNPISQFSVKTFLIGCQVIILAVTAAACGDNTNDQPIIDNPPIIISSDIPGSVLHGERNYLEVNAEDDHGVRSVSIDIPGAGIENMALRKTNGLWTGTITLEQVGDYEYTLRVTDDGNNTVTASGSIVCEANTLTAEQIQKLTGYLEELSDGWHQPSVDAANTILSDESLGPAVWESFFDGYFSNHSFTDNLRNYLGYPVYWWFSDTVYANLQQGLYKPLTGIINNETDAYLQSSKASLTRDSYLVQSLMNSHRFLNDMIRLQAPGVEYRDDIFDFYRTLIKENASLYGTTCLDVDEYPFAGAFRAQAHINLVDAPELTYAISNQIIDTLELTGIKREIFYDYGVLVIDNHGLDTTHLELIQSLLDSVPSGMYNLTNITVYDFFGNAGDNNLWLSRKSGVNIFGVRVGAMIGNSFPSDVASIPSDTFFGVLAHELNHIVDGYFVENNVSLKERKEALLNQAGADTMNYLRSMFDDGFFQQYPQEFFASISNQYFSSSEHTLQLGIGRFNQGRPEPLNQFLFFADVYSRGEDFTLFYISDTAGNLTRTEIPLERDGQGRIAGLYIGETYYSFQLDTDGNVVSFTED